MAQVVQPDRREAGAVDEDPEPGGGVAGVDRFAVLAGEHVAGVGPGLVGGVAAVELVAAVCAQDGDGVFVQGDGPASGGGLRVAFDDLIAGGPQSRDARVTLRAGWLVSTPR
ncbi:hypothetical protein [Actinoplanes sp. N902-109]|uniref:hypothetical protein n=1 Tax=Actinoplanes sp. (strain N902-109) TaxID=649831 RepID=UPI0003A66C62